MNATSTTGCGSSTCACSELAQPSVAHVNGIALHEPGEALDAQTLRERACTELLRQQAVRAGLLPRYGGLIARAPDETQRQIIEAMVDQVVSVPEPTEDECRRHYAAQKSRFIVGQALHVRHILFAVTPGVNVHALTLRAEAALLELTRKDVSPGRFDQLAGELSNCPSSAQGGDLGWLTPDDCAPELANELFFQSDSRWGMGVHPRLVNTRFGLHIIEVLGRKKGRLPEFEELRQQIASRLLLQSRTTALRQYMQLLVGEAQIEGVDLIGADSPLVQ
ncbi:PpiC-type peptidyl-prolyl cis-trans isomerase [Hydrogenophaga taeniospiralis CCUG 15921]|uniref:peptidylprolyl isomerase n=1 Tax=Hydrogenophaga taeniospiralis CCUG 15921 TaxID=1281780 RepID=A0A9X4SD00_9BURK|nr:peptidylprolyl isomerase [Hydrogenophaga taeniospiralis]MDG5977298.1 PpiC-type peptidyl-prolyl cis-trans isomerase [Hydrogenophaga taeniospiralis CCUG 15921]